MVYATWNTNTETRAIVNSTGITGYFAMLIAHMSEFN